jgi:hypothetical protein
MPNLRIKFPLTTGDCHCPMLGAQVVPESAQLVRERDTPFSPGR